MTEKTQEWAERVGREAVALGFAPIPGLMAMRENVSLRLSMHFGPWADFVPDFRDLPTELACIAWVEDVAREVYERDTEIEIELSLSLYTVRTGSTRDPWHFEAPTLAEACIAAVRAMKGEPC